MSNDFIRILKKNLISRSASDPAFVSSVLESSIDDGDSVMICRKKYFSIIKKIDYDEYYKKNENVDYISDNDIERRLRICNSCDFWKKIVNSKYGNCSKCSCALSFKIKNKTSACPIERW
jgi:hypothetical protein